MSNRDSAAETDTGAKRRFFELSRVADQCPGYAMCRIDFLGTGICPVAKKRRFAAFYPQGRMQVIRAYREGRIPITKGLVEIALSCQRCDICEKQCYFIAGLRPLELFRAFREYVLQERHRCVPVDPDPITEELGAIVGKQWVSADPAICAGYAYVRSPLAPAPMPKAVALPQAAPAVSALVKLCAARGVPFVARGSATSLGGATTEGLIIDLSRMDRITVQPDRYCGVVEPGVYAYDLQKQAARHGLRANVAEPAACVCSNVMCTNMHSFFSYAYGAGADHYLDAEFVGPQGDIYRLSDERAPNLFFPRKERRPNYGICTGMEVRLYPLCPDEYSVLVPCESVESALEIARQIARRRIGIGLGVIGTFYLSMFAAPTAKSVDEIRSLLEDTLGARAFVLVLGDRISLSAVRALASPVLDRDLVSLLIKALPSLPRNGLLRTIAESEGDDCVYRAIFADDMRPLLETALRSAGNAAWPDVDADMKKLFEDFRLRPENSDPMHLSTFRILPARMGRNHQFIARILYVSLEQKSGVLAACEELADIAKRHSVRHGFGYVVPLAEGTRAVLEYDFYFDRTDAAQTEAVCAAMKESSATVKRLCGGPAIVASGETVVMQGLCRPEAYLFGDRDESV